MRIKGLIKRISVLASIILIGSMLAVPAFADDTTTKANETKAILAPGNNKSTGFATKIADAAGGKAEDVEYVVWCDDDLCYRPIEDEKYANTSHIYTESAEYVGTAVGFTADDGTEISPSDKNHHVWAWYDKDGTYKGTGSNGKPKTVYVYTDAAKVYVHKNQTRMFYDGNSSPHRVFTNLKGVSLFGEKLDWSYVSNMQAAFYKCSSLEELDLSGFTGKLVSEESQTHMFSRMDSLKKLTLPSTWTFTGSMKNGETVYGVTGLEGNWEIDGKTYTAYKIETSGKFGGGTYEKVTDEAADYDEDNHEDATYQGRLEDSTPDNMWEIHDVSSKFTGFCIDGYPYTWTTEQQASQKYPGASAIYGYYNREKWDSAKAKNGVSEGSSGTYKMNWNYYLNSDYYFGSSQADELEKVTADYKKKAPGETLEEILTALLYWGPQVYGTKKADGTYSIATIDQYNLLQQDIWCFTNWYGQVDWLSGSEDDSLYSKDHAKYADAWKGKTFDSIPDAEVTQLYVYKSLNGSQNAIGVKSVKAPEYDVIISKTDITGTQEIAGAKLTITNAAGETVKEWTTKTTTVKEDGKDVTKVVPTTVTLAPGTYTLTETTAPDGFEKAESITFKVDKNGKVTSESTSSVSEKDDAYTVTMKDDYSKVHIAFYKINGNGDGLSGAKIKLTLNSTVAGVENNASYAEYLKEHGGKFEMESTFEPDKEDGAVLTLYPGEYTLSEEEAPNGYGKAENITFKVDSKGNVFCFSKDESGKITKVWRFNDKSKTGSLAPTEYTSMENAKSDKTYPVKTESIVYDKTDTKTKDALDHIFMKDDITIKISKVDIAGEEIPGATLTITDKDGNKVEEWTTKTVTVEEDGKKVEKVLPTEVQVAPGKYTLTETTCPQGYTKAESIEFTVGDDGKVSYTGKDTTTADDTVKMTDDYQPATVIFKKTDGKDILENAKLILKSVDENGKETDVTTWTSSKENKEVQLKPGTYVYRETAAPDYYVTADDIKIRVAVGGKVYIVSGDKETEVKDNTVTMVDNKTSVEVSKVKESDGKTFLEGAKLQILDSDKKVVVEWTSDSKAYTIKGKLKVGEKYTLHEVSAPTGYKVAGDITFTCTGKDQKIVMKDAALATDKPGTITIKKVDSTNTSKFVSGAKLQILDSDGKVVEEWTSGTTAYKVTKTLEVGKTYKLHEVSAPSGYKVASDVSFTVSTSAKTITMKDVPETTTTYTIVVSKVDENGSYVSGAKMQVLDSNGKVIDSWTTSSGTHTVNATMTKGSSYTIHEVSAPDGYELASDKKFTYSSNQTIKVVDKKKTTEKTTETDTPSTTTNTTKTTTSSTTSSTEAATSTDEVAPATEETTKVVETVETKSTGDASNMALWVGAIVVVAAAAGVVIYKKKNKKAK